MRENHEGTLHAALTEIALIIWAAWTYRNNPTYRKGCESLDMSCFSKLNSRKIKAITYYHGNLGDVVLERDLEALVSFNRKVVEMARKEHAEKQQREAADEIANLGVDANNGIPFLSQNNKGSLR